MSEPIVRVLLCDDVAEIRVLLRYALEEDPTLRVVGEAEDGAAGLRLVGETEPDVVLLDLSMPGRDGLEILPELRAVEPHAPGVVVFSGFACERLGPRLLALGADRYVEKGAPLERLRRTVREVAAERAPAA